MAEQLLASMGEAIAAWTLHYEAHPDEALSRAVELRKALPDNRRAELVGAVLALTPAEHRCPHYGDRRNCAHCLTDSENP